MISYALVLLFHPEYTLLPAHYPDLYKSHKHQSDVAASSTVETDHAASVAAMNLTPAANSNTTGSLRSVCWTNCGVLYFFTLCSLKLLFVYVRNQFQISQILKILFFFANLEQ